MKAIIETEQLCYEYMTASGEDNKVVALDNIDVSIEKGSFTVIMGTNGSGKSTLAKSMNALFFPTSGRVTVNGMDTADPEHLWDIRSTAGMIFQNPDNQLVSSIVEDDVAFGPENLGLPSEVIRERVDEAMKAVGIYEHRMRNVHLLSGGQKQRAAIAGVLAMRPECIIFDESTSMLDPKGRKDVLSVIEELNSSGITVVLITHFMEEAVMADRVIIMNDGRAVSDGTPEKVFSDTALIESCGLDLPHAIRIRNRLRAAGFDIPDSVLDMEALADWLSSEGGSPDEDRS